MKTYKAGKGTKIVTAFTADKEGAGNDRLPNPTIAFHTHKRHCDKTDEMLKKELAEEYQAQDM